MYSNAGGQKPRLIGELSAASDRVSVSDFRYGRGAEIFGEAEPAEYIYQVIEGAVRTHKLLPDGRRQIGAFISLETSSDWRTAQLIGSRRKPLSRPWCVL
jgi:hypothetical protein